MPRHHCRALLLAAAGVVAASLAAFAATGPQVLTGGTEPATAHAAALSLPRPGAAGDSARCASVVDLKFLTSPAALSHKELQIQTTLDS